MDNTACVILAAGKGSRLKCGVPKPLLSINGKPLLQYVVEASRFKENVSVSLVLGHEGEKIESVFKSSTEEVVWQDQQLGTGHALKCFLEQSSVLADNILVLCADTPLLDGELLKRFYTDFFDKNLNASCISFNADDPSGYGRVVKLSKGLKIVEEKDADPSQKKITTVTVTHDMQSVYEFSDYTAFIENGSISWYGKSNEIKRKGNKSILNFIKGSY